ncbi:MAG: hypothetical protein ACYSW4_04945 [Planctomycetota bacterium]|jgi:hypothetical protein
MPWKKKHFLDKERFSRVRETKRRMRGYVEINLYRSAPGGLPEPGIGEIGEVIEVDKSVKVEIGFFAIMRVFCEKSGFGLAILVQKHIFGS